MPEKYPILRGSDYGVFALVLFFILLGFILGGIRACGHD